MSGSIPNEFIKDLLLRVEIVDLIDSHVPLKKSGANYVARCPFHSEKTPSFSVSPKKQLYHCFGCGAGGDAINFLMDFNHLEFVEAVEDLASFAGIAVPREAQTHASSTSVKQQNVAEIYQLLAKVATYYREQLRDPATGGKAVDYLKRRGVSGQVAKHFVLGYAPDRWDALLSRFNNQNLLMDAGLLARNEAGRVYDRFRGRLMFPIRDKRNRIVGFGGRVLDDSVPKYLNSPETAVFSKGHEVYGLYELLEDNSKPRRILIVEGYMDVIALAEYGINYAVATLGTATSKAHLDLLFRFSSELVFCFDGDDAGRQAAWRALETVLPCLRDGRQVKIMLLPQSHDPDSMVREEGLHGFEARIEQAQALSDYFFEQAQATSNLSVLEGRARLLAEAKPYLERLPGGIFKEMMLARLQGLVGVSCLTDSDNQATLNSSPVRTKRLEHLKLTPLRVVLALLLQNPELIKIFAEVELELLNIEFQGKELLMDICRSIQVKQPENAAILLDALRATKWEKEARILANLKVSPDGVADFDESAEFRGALARVVELGRKRYRDQLLEKESKEGLTVPEKNILLGLLSATSR